MAWTTLPTWITRPVTAALLAAMTNGISELRPVTAAKTLTTSRNSTTTDTADPHLVLALAASKTYDIKGVLLVSSAANAAGDFKFSFTFPTGAELTVAPIGVHDSLASSSSADGQFAVITPDASSPTSSLSFGASTTATGIQVEGRITVGSTAGNLTLLWSQLSSNANATSLLQGSWLTAYPVG